MIFNALFILNFNWRLTRGLKVNASLLSLFIQSNLKKAPLEIVIPNIQQPINNEKHLDLLDYLKEKREEHKKGRVQSIQINALSEKDDLTLFLN